MTCDHLGLSSATTILLVGFIQNPTTSDVSPLSNFPSIDAPLPLLGYKFSLFFVFGVEPMLFPLLQNPFVVVRVPMVTAPLNKVGLTDL